MNPLNLFKRRKINSHLQLLGTLYLVMTKARKSGFMAIEMDVDKPKQSQVFTAIAGFDDADAPVYTFVCDVLPLIVGGNLEPRAMERYMAAYRKTTDSNKEQTSLFDTAQLVLIAFLEGYAPSICIERGRQGVPAKLKPSFLELENFILDIRREPEPSQENLDSRLADFYQSIGAQDTAPSSVDAPSFGNISGAPQTS